MRAMTWIVLIIFGLGSIGRLVYLAQGNYPRTTGMTLEHPWQDVFGLLISVALSVWAAWLLFS